MCPSPFVLLVPGLRDHVESHWQTHLLRQLPRAGSVPPMGRDDLSCTRRVQAIEAAVATIEGPVLLVAHSAGCVMVAHWAQGSCLTHRIQGALLATPPDFERPMPSGYPTPQALAAGGWLPVPRRPLPFPSLTAVSADDPLATAECARELARDWGSATVELGPVRHLNPASGYGAWPMALQLLARLAPESGLSNCAVLA